jgi:hypothetical protein
MRQKLIMQELEQINNFIQEIERNTLNTVSVSSSTLFSLASIEYRTHIAKVILGHNPHIAGLWTHCGGGENGTVVIEHLGQALRQFRLSESVTSSSVKTKDASTNSYGRTGDTVTSDMPNTTNGTNYVQKLRAFDDSSTFIEVLIRTCALKDRHVKIEDLGRCCRQFSSSSEVMLQQLSQLAPESRLCVCPPLVIPCWKYVNCCCSRLFCEPDGRSGGLELSGSASECAGLFDAATGIMWSSSSELQLLQEFLISTGAQMGGHGGIVTKPGFNDETNSTVRIKRVRGPRHSGKSTKLMYVAHNLPAGTDVLWVDCTHVRTIADMYASFNSQLFICFGNVEGNSGYDDYDESFLKLMSLLRAGSLLILDNLFIDDSYVTESVPSIHAAVNDLIVFVGDLKRKCDHYRFSISVVLVNDNDIASLDDCISTSLFNSVGQGSFTIPPLAPEVALTLAKEVFAVDPAALVSASGCLPGLMVHLAQFVDVEVIDNMARDRRAYTAAEAYLSQENSSLAARHVAECIARELDSDETLCGTCLLRGIAPFQDSLAWELCREAFDNDVLRWRIAFLGLLESGWLMLRADRGYVVSASSMVRPIDTVGLYGFNISPTMQWAAYLVHWAGELVYMNRACIDEFALISGASRAETTIRYPYALLAFDAQFLHIQNVFDLLLSSSESSGTVTQNSVTGESSEVMIDHPSMVARRVACMLVGNVNAILSHRFSSPDSVKIAHLICEYVFKQQSSKYGVIFT